MRHAVRKVLLGILLLFLLPLAVHAAFYAGKDRPASFRDADWSSVGMLPPADADRAVAASADAPAFDGGTRDRRAGRAVP